MAVTLSLRATSVAIVLPVGVFLTATARTVGTTYQQTNLVSDGSVPRRHVDPNLINPWGLTHGPTTPFLWGIKVACGNLREAHPPQ
jgi:hypothetical protein